MADDFSNKRKFEDPSVPRRASGFSSPTPDAKAPPPSYNSVPPPADDIQLAKQRAQEIAARLFSAAEAKRPRVEGDGGEGDNGFGGSAGADHSYRSLGQQTSSQVGATANPPSSYSAYGYSGASKKIDIPNDRVGVIIGKGGETIKYLQLQSGAKIQVTRDMDADPNSQTRLVELTGTSEQISKAEQLIKDVLAEAEAGSAGVVSNRKFMGAQVGAEHFIMKVPNNKVGLVIGKGGETIKSMQAKSGARIQLIPLHLPPGDTSTERTVHIDGTAEQIESAKQLVNEVISENRVRNPQMGGGYPQEGYRPPRPQTSWGPPGQPPMQQPGYGYMQPGAYPGPPPQYNMSQPPYSGYPPPATSTGYAGWEQSPNPPSQQNSSGSGYDYYNQQSQPQQQPPPVGSSTSSDNTGYNYGQLPATNYSTQGSYGENTYSQQSSGQQQGYGQDGYGGGYQAPAQPQGYAQQPSNTSGYDQQNYGSAQYGAAASSGQDGSAPAYGSQGGPAQPPPAQQGPPGQTPPPTQQPATNPPSYSAGYGNQPPPSAYGQPSPRNPSPYGQPQSQKPPQSGYPQPTSMQSGYGNTQAPPHGYGGAPPPAYGSGAPQSGYGQQPYGGPPPQGYGQQPQQGYGDSYGAGYSQTQAYSSDGATGGGGHAAYDGQASGQAAAGGSGAPSPPKS